MWGREAAAHGRDDTTMLVEVAAAHGEVPPQEVVVLRRVVHEGLTVPRLEDEGGDRRRETEGGDERDRQPRVEAVGEVALNGALAPARDETARLRFRGWLARGEEERGDAKGERQRNDGEEGAERAKEEDVMHALTEDAS
eukprot:831383-Prymnesium_polylepis.1